MAKVIYTLPNAPDEIDGIKFVPHPDGIGMVSEDISDEKAERLVTIKGFALVGKKPELSDEEKAAAEAAAEAELNAAIDKAKALGVTVKGNWKLERIQHEIEKAEKAAKDKADAEAKGGAGGENK